jgi:hypothetical protein
MQGGNTLEESQESVCVCAFGGGPLKNNNERITSNSATKDGLLCKDEF